MNLVINQIGTETLYHIGKFLVKVSQFNEYEVFTAVPIDLSSSK